MGAADTYCDDSLAPDSSHHSAVLTLLARSYRPSSFQQRQIDRRLSLPCSILHAATIR